jgi:cobalt-zinc-cadmium efflux system membrane fusion protein
MKSPGGRVVIAVGVLAIVGFSAARYLATGAPAGASAREPATDSDVTAPAGPTIELTGVQLESLKIGPVERHAFPVELEAVGGIDFDEDLSVQVFPPYQGKIISAMAQLGDAVRKGQPLYTIDSPDLVQAESTLIGAAATFELTDRELARAGDLYGTIKGVSQREWEQAVSDRKTAEGALRAARDAVRMFGKTEEEIDRLVETRKIDPALVVASPFAGQITARNAQIGLLVQPGNPPAPYAVSNLDSKLLLASVAEQDSPMLKVGQALEVSVMAYPGRKFAGTVSAVGATVDPNTHRVTVRSEISDAGHELIPGMVATFRIRVGEPVESPAVPMNGVVREGDGTMTAWVTGDRRHFTQRTIRVGLESGGWREVLDGLRPGELVVTDGAVFLSNMLSAPPSD